MPDSAPDSAAPVCAAVTVLVIACMAIKAKGILRLWSPVAGVVCGSVAAGLYGVYDTDGLHAAAWLGLPSGGWPGIDFRFDRVFWTLLPTFLFLTLIGAIETLGDTVAIQRVSWRRPRAVDFQSVQGAIAADGTGNLLSGLLGTVPNTTYSSSISMTELTGVAARSVGVAVGALFVLLAFVPKALAVVLAITRSRRRRLSRCSGCHALCSRDESRGGGGFEPPHGNHCGRLILGSEQASNKVAYSPGSPKSLPAASWPTE